MLLSSIIERCLDYTALKGEVTENGVVNTAHPIVIDLMNCANTVYALFASQYGIFKESENVKPLNKIITYDLLSKRVNSVISVKEDHVNIKYKATVNGIKVDTDREVTIEYYYYPDVLNYNDTIFLIDYINEYTLPYMIVSEYYTKAGIYDKAKMFFDKFNLFMEDIKLKRQISLKVEKWL